MSVFYSVAFTAMLMFTSPTFGHDLQPGDVLINPSHSIETTGFLVTIDHISERVIDLDIRRFRPELWSGWSYVAYSLTNKVTGQERTTLIEAGSERYVWFTAFIMENYCGVDVLFVTTQRPPVRYGGTASRILTTYIFRADTLELLEEYEGTAYDVARFDSRWVPEVDSSMDERYLVSCLAAGPGHPFGFGLIDRKRLYGPDWCGPGGARCRVAAPAP